MNEPQKHVFISYSTPDKAAASALCDVLECQNIACWIAPRDVPPGADYAEQIISGIECTKLMLLVLSSHANLSRHVRNEVERAVSKGKVVLPVRTENVNPSRSLELFISSHQWIDLFGEPLAARLTQVAIAVQTFLSGESATDGTVISRSTDKRPQLTTFTARSGIVTGNAVFLRSGPTVAAKPVAQLNQGDEVRLIGQVTVDAARECLCKNELSFKPESGEPYRLRAGKGLVISGETEEDYRVEVVRRGVRDIGYIPKTAVTVLGQALWYKVKHGGTSGWVLARFLQVY